MSGKNRNNGMRDVIIIAIVMIVFGATYFALRQPPVVPQPPSQSANVGGHQSMGGMDQLNNLPTDYNGLVGIGHQSMDEGNYSVAAECYRRALEIDSSDDNVRVDFGACLHAMGLGERALDEFRTVMSHNNGHTIVQFNAGVVHSSLGNADSAMYYLEKYIAMDPNGRAVGQAKSIMEQLNESGK